jgi:transposase
MTNHPMQRLAEPLRKNAPHGDTPSPAAGGKRRAGAQPLTPSTAGMLGGGEGTADLRPRQPCTGPFAHGDQARRAQGSRGPEQRDDVFSPMSSSTRVRDPLDQHNRGKRVQNFGASNGIRVEIVGNPNPTSFAVAHKRWLVERTNAWISGARRLTKDHERTVASSEAHIFARFSKLMAGWIQRGSIS